jgi:outer membrane protein assembly factor BamB
MRSLAAVAALLLAGTAHAGPLGPAWRTKLEGKFCPQRLETPNSGLVISEAGKIRVHDAKTGTPTAWVPAVDGKPMKDPFLIGIAGDTLVLNADKTTVGVEVKTGTLRWRRDATSKFTSPRMGGADVVELDIEKFEPVEVRVERHDATTGKRVWTAKHASKDEKFYEVVASAKRVYVVTEKKTEPRGFTITALGDAGKVAWTVHDRELGSLPKLRVHGDDLFVTVDNKLRVYAAADGKLATWQTGWNAFPILAGGVVYATPGDRTVEARDPVTGKERWKTPLPEDTRGPFATVLGETRGIVYVRDHDQLLSFDAKSGKQVASFGLGVVESLRVHAPAPALTMCTKTEIIAVDPSTPAKEHTITVSGRIRCTNCSASTKVKLHLADQAVVLGPDRKFSLTVTARGEHRLTLHDEDFVSAGTQLKWIAFDKDRTLKLGELRVKVPAVEDH